MQKKSAVALCVLFIACFGLAGLFGTGSVGKPVKLPNEELAKLKATAKVIVHEPIFHQPDDFVASVYNGTRWKIVDVEVQITAKAESRTFKLSKWGREGMEFNENGDVKKLGKLIKVPGEPLTSTDFEADIGSFLTGLAKGEWSWSIQTVYGFKE